MSWLTLAPSCLNLLKGQKDEEKFAGLLVVAAQLKEKPTDVTPPAPKSVVDSIDASTQQYEEGGDGGDEGDEKKRMDDDNDDDSDDVEDMTPGRPPRNPIFHVHSGSSTSLTPTVAKPSVKELSDAETAKYLATILEIYQAVGLRFLSRLLKTVAVQALAVNLLSTFSQHPLIAKDLVPFAPKLLELTLTLEGESLMDTANTLTHVLMHETNNINSSSDSVVVLVKRIPSLEGPARIAVVELISQILRYSKDVTTLAPLILPTLCNLFQLPTAIDIKFQLLRAIAFLLKDHHRLPPQVFQGQWTKDLRVGLTQILTNRTADEWRFLSLTLISYMLQRADSGWAVSTREGEKSGQFVHIIINVVSVEIRVLLMIMGGPRPQKELTQTIIACFTILELAMQFLVDESSEWTKLDIQVMMTLQKKFSEIYSEVYLFLREMRDTDQTQSELVVACIRAVGAWVSEETEALQDEFRDLLPWMLSVPSIEGVDPLLFLAPCVLQLALDEQTAIQCLEWCTAAHTADRIVDTFLQQHSLLQKGQPLSITTSQLSSYSELLRTLVLCSAPVNKSTKSATDVCSRNLKALMELGLLLTDLENDSKQAQETKEEEHDRAFCAAAYLSLMLAIMHAHSEESFPPLGDEVYARFWVHLISFFTSEKCGGEYKLGDMFGYSLSLLSDCLTRFPRAIGGVIIQTKAFEDYCAVVEVPGSEMLAQAIDQLLRKTASANPAWRREISNVVMSRTAAHAKLPQTLRLLRS